MIGYLSGTIQHIEAGGNLDIVILNVGGVGYLVTCPRDVVQGVVGDPAEVWIHSITREDGTRLYGFSDRGDIQGFIKLLDVQGVGAKVALALITALGWQGLLQAISTKDSVQLVQADGVGKKLAERIVHELSAKLGALSDLTQMPISTAAPAGSNTRSEAISALTNLGYSATQAHLAVNAALQSDPAISLEALITTTLRTLHESSVGS